MRETRFRRGREVEIPEEWQGEVTHPQTIRKRASKLTGKARRQQKRTRPDRSPSPNEWPADPQESEGE